MKKYLNKVQWREGLVEREGKDILTRERKAVWKFHMKGVCRPLATLLVVAFLLGSLSINLPIAQGEVNLGNISSAASSDPVGVVIGFHGKPDRALVEQYHGQVYMELEMINALAATMCFHSAMELTRYPEVSFVEVDKPVFSSGWPDTAVPVLTAGFRDEQVVPWGITRVFGNQPYPFPAWETTTGDGMGVAILDTGVYRDHEDIEATGGVNFSESPGGTFAYEYFDSNGHGTHVTGIVGALDNEIGVVGIAPGVDAFAVKILDDTGLGTVSSVINGIQWAVQGEIPIINMSLYSSTYSRSLELACDTAYRNGYLLVAAAGNLGRDNGRGENVSYPAAYDAVIAVAASDEGNQRASFSSTGPEVELIAPGKDIWSTWTANNYQLFSGTSMASLHVVGAAALAWSADPDLTNVQIRNLLQQTALDLGLAEQHQGYGLVRADRAVEALGHMVPPGVAPKRGAEEVIMEIGSKTAYFDGLPYEMDVAPFIQSSRTFVPVRFLGEAFAAEVDWEPKDSRVETVYLQRDDIEITITIGSPSIAVYQKGAASIVISDVAAFISQGRTFLPFRVLAEAFEATVGYESSLETRLVTRVWFRQ